MSTFRFAWFALSLIAAFAASATPADRYEPVLGSLRLGDSRELLVGMRVRQADPAMPPEFAWRVTGTSDEPWSRIERLDPALAGWPVELRQAPWRLQTAGFEPGQSIHHRLVPMTAAPDIASGRVEVVDGMALVRVASIDDGTILMLEQDVRGRLFLRRIVAEGSTHELEVAKKRVWRTAWPQSAQLFGVDADGDRVAAFGTIGPTTVVAATLPESAVPELSLPSAGLVAGALFAEGPAVAALTAGRLRLFVLRVGGWQLEGETAWPQAAKAGAILLAEGATKGSAVIAVTNRGPGGWPGETLIITHDSQGFGATLRPTWWSRKRPGPSRTVQPICPPTPSTLPRRLIFGVAACAHRRALPRGPCRLPCSPGARSRR